MKFAAESVPVPQVVPYLSWFGQAWPGSALGHAIGRIFGHDSASPTATPEQPIRAELFGVPEEAARLRFRDFMAKREAPAAAAFPGAESTKKRRV